MSDEVRIPPIVPAPDAVQPGSPARTDVAVPPVVAGVPVAGGARKSRTLGTVLKVLGGLALLFLICIGTGIGVIWYEATRPSYGPREAEEGTFTLAPQVTVELLPSHYSLRDAAFTDFDISPQGAIVVNRTGQLYDLGGGGKLGPERKAGDGGVASLAFVGGGLVVSYDFARAEHPSGLAYFRDDQFVPLDLEGVTATAVAANQRGDRLYVADHHQLYSLVEGQALQAECGSPEDITAITGDDVSCVFAAHGAVFRLIAPGEPLILVKLPEMEDIVGLAATNETIYFATTRNVYVLRDGAAMPLAIGLGGKLHLRPDGLYVLDALHGRVYRLVVGKPK